MMTNIISAITHDIMKVVKNESFFEEHEKTRLAQVNRVLGEVYPHALKTYLSTVSAQSFTMHMTSLFPMLVSQSILAMKQNIASHALLKVCAEAIKETWNTPYTGNTRFQKVMQDIFEHEHTSSRSYIAEREIQQFIVYALQEDSPRLQMATDDVNEMNIRHQLQTVHGGVPSLRVIPMLIGGSRLFLNGILIDQSWRARIHALLSALR